MSKKQENLAGIGIFIAGTIVAGSSMQSAELLANCQTEHFPRLCIIRNPGPIETNGGNPLRNQVNVVAGTSSSTTAPLDRIFVKGKYNLDWS